MDHIQRINRLVPYWMRLSHTITSGKCRARNGGGTLYQRSTRRRLAQSSALLDRLHGLGLNRSWQIFCGSSSQALEVPQGQKLIGFSVGSVPCEDLLGNNGVACKLLNTSPAGFLTFVSDCAPAVIASDELPGAPNEGTLRAFRYADRFTTFKIFRRPGAL
jgi:hypothetical protein